MAIKRVSVNWTAKLNDSKDLPKYGDSGDGKFSKKFGEGRKRITPCWRTLKSDRQTNPKYPGGGEAIREKLEAEGHAVIQKGKRFLVDGFEKKTVVPKLK